METARNATQALDIAVASAGIASTTVTWNSASTTLSDALTQLANTCDSVLAGSVEYSALTTTIAGAQDLEAALVGQNAMITSLQAIVQELEDAQT